MRKLSVTVGALVGSVLVSGIEAAPAPTPAASNYTLTAATFGPNATVADATQIIQLAFRPGDANHVYASRSSGVITRFDYAVSGSGAILSNATNVLSGLNNPYGLAFHGNDLYYSLNPFSSGRSTGQINRVHLDGSGNVISSPQVIVNGITNGTQHGTNQIFIRNNSLYVGVGINGQWRTDATHPATDFGGGYDEAWNGSIAVLSDLTTLTDLTPTDTLSAGTFTTPDSSKLRLYATGMRNPFAVRVDSSGKLWTSDNGSDTESTGLMRPPTDDLLYRDVKQNDQGVFPTQVGASAGSPNNTGLPGTGATIQPFIHVGRHTAATGFDFITTGPDAGNALLARYGSAYDQVTGYDLVLSGLNAAGPTLDNTSSDGSISLYTGFYNPVDVMRDLSSPSRFLIADRDPGTTAIYILTAPVPEPAMGLFVLVPTLLMKRRRAARSL